jgi:3-deoxy-D-manno-octulosonate 8-phosphate phosphatase KdsC-like HAD superfamily phosphatase
VDVITDNRGGRGALRDFAELIIFCVNEKNSDAVPQHAITN